MSSVKALQLVVMFVIALSLPACSCPSTMIGRAALDGPLAPRNSNSINGSQVPAWTLSCPRACVRTA